MLTPSTSPNSPLTPNKTIELTELRKKFNQLLLTQMNENPNQRLDLSKIWEHSENLPELYVFVRYQKHK